MADFDDIPQPTSEELAALELYHQLLNLGPDNGDRALMVTLRLPSGRYIGDVWLSTTDVELTVDKLIAVNIQRADLDDPPADPLPELPQVDWKDVADVVHGFQQLLSEDGDA